jgi:hypothetical protein
VVRELPKVQPTKIAEQFDDMIENFRIDNNLTEEDIIEQMKGYIKFKLGGVV